MRILFAVQSHKKGVDIPLLQRTWQDRDWSSALHEMGHEVINFNWELETLRDLKRWKKEEKGRLNNELVRLVKKENEKKPIDIVFSASSGRNMLPKTIENIKALGPPIVNFFTDDVNTFHRNEENAPLFTYNWTTQLKAIKNYKRVGASYIYIHL